MDVPITEQGNKHVLVLKDFLTKLPLVYAMPDQKTESILVDELIPLLGIPEALLSDRGTNFLSHSMKYVIRDNATAYHPQCDGLTERSDRTLKTVLRKRAAKYGPQWDR